MASSFYWMLQQDMSVNLEVLLVWGDHLHESPGGRVEKRKYKKNTIISHIS